MAYIKQILIITHSVNNEHFSSLKEDGFSLSFSEDVRLLESSEDKPSPNLIILDMNSNTDGENVSLIKNCKDLGIPIFAILESNNNNHMDSSLETDDIIFSPFEHEEISARIRRVLWKHGEWDLGQLIRIGDLVIDQDKYEVSVARNKVILTFKEYQLLCLLASNPGRVYSRETLLSRIWDYDYFGGTRTVDVHIRRLRSKVEDANHLFIETVRNVGYRFKTI